MASDIEDKPEEVIEEGAGGGGPRRRGPKPKGPAQKKGKEKREKTPEELLKPNEQQWFEAGDRTVDTPGIYPEAPRIHWSAGMRTKMEESHDSPVWYFLESFPPDAMRDCIRYTRENGLEGITVRQDILRFIGMRLGMCLYPLTGHKRDYWMRDPSDQSLEPVMGFGKYLSRDRFFDIESKIRFAPPEDPDLDAEDRDLSPGEAIYRAFQRPPKRAHFSGCLPHFGRDDVSVERCR